MTEGRAALRGVRALALQEADCVPVRLPAPPPFGRLPFWDVERDIHRMFPLRGDDHASDARVCCGEEPAWSPPWARTSELLIEWGRGVIVAFGRTWHADDRSPCGPDCPAHKHLFPSRPAGSRRRRR